VGAEEVIVELRPYQLECIEAIYGWLRTHDSNPCAVIPTGGGKTPIMATICHDAVSRWGGRVLVVAHVKELLEQTCDKLSVICPGVDYGVYSAGLGRRDTEHSVIVAGIQSIHKKACDLGPFDLIIVDEAHLIPMSGDGMYRQFLADAKVVNPSVRVIGLTATPYRTGDGPICTDAGILNHVCYEVGVHDLIAGGYLCDLVSKVGERKADFAKILRRGGEFVPHDAERIMDDAELVRAACQEIVESTAAASGVLIFCSGVQHAEHVVQELATAHSISCGLITGDTTGLERATTLERFRRRELKYLANVSVLTTGLDVHHIDCVVLLRPTLSSGLYYQMVGRGFRLSPGKDRCLILDFGGNVLRHGPVDAIITRDPKKGLEGDGAGAVKECPACRYVVPVACLSCSQCGHEFPAAAIAKHDAESGTEGVLSGGVTVTEHQVYRCSYSVHSKKGSPPDAPRTLRVDYEIRTGVLKEWLSEWVCFEHEGFAREKAVKWWRDRSPDPVPRNAGDAVDIAENGGVAETISITVRTVASERFPRITKCKIGGKPDPVETRPDFDLSEVPF